MSPGPDRQLEGHGLPKDSHFHPYLRPTPAPKSEPQDTLLLPPGAPLVLLDQLQCSAAAYNDATRDQPCLVSGPLEAPFMLGAAHPQGLSLPDMPLNVDVARGRFAIEPINENMLEDRESMPTRAAWKEVAEAYINHLHPSKRAKALIDYETYCNIFKVLLDPDSRAVGTPQFRFWSRKMFKLVEEEEKLVVTSGGRPVAIKEHIYDIICISHFMCKHGGRDKTCKIVRDHYTWIPKELIANFVKACPTCKSRKIQIVRSNAEALQASFSVESIESFGRPQPADAPLAMGTHAFQNSASASTSAQQGPADQYLSPPNNSESINAFPLRMHLPTPQTTATTMSMLSPDESFSASTSSGCPSAHPDIPNPSHHLPPLMQFLSRDGTVATSPSRFIYSNSAVRSSAIDPSLYGAIPAACSCAQPTCSVCNSCQTSHESGALYEPYGRALHLELGPTSAVLASQSLHTISSSFPSSYSNCSSTNPFEQAGETSMISASSATTGPELPTPSTTTQNFATLLHSNSNESLPDAACEDLPLPVAKGCAPALRINTAGLASACVTPPIYSPRPLKAGDPVNALMRALEKQKATSSTSKRAGSQEDETEEGQKSAEGEEVRAQESHRGKQEASTSHVVDEEQVKAS